MLDSVSVEIARKRVSHSPTNSQTIVAGIGFHLWAAPVLASLAGRSGSKAIDRKDVVWWSGALFDISGSTVVSTITCDVTCEVGWESERCWDGTGVELAKLTMGMCALSIKPNGLHSDWSFLSLILAVSSKLGNYVAIVRL